MESKLTFSIGHHDVHLSSTDMYSTGALTLGLQTGSVWRAKQSESIGSFCKKKVPSDCDTTNL